MCSIKKMAVTQLGSAITGRGFEVSALVPALGHGALEITAEGGQSRIIGKRPDGRLLFTVPVPAGYDITRAQATYINGELRESSLRPMLKAPHSFRLWLAPLFGEAELAMLAMAEGKPTAAPS
jgi:hypothetical protein